MTAPLITIGRFTGVLVDIARSGDTLRIAGRIDRGSDAETAIRMQQLSGMLGNRDEPIVPVICPVKPDLDGFYRPVGGGIAELRGATKNIGKWTWTIDLERISGGFGHPSFESTLYTVVRTNGHSITAPTLGVIFGHPRSDLTFAGSSGDYTSVVANAPANELGLLTEDTDDGEMTVGQAATPLPRSTFRWWAPPAEFYTGACRVEVLVDGVWNPLVGRQVGRFDHWRISNGIVRLTVASGDEPGRFEYWLPAESRWGGVDVAHSEYDTGDEVFFGTLPIGFGGVSMLTVLRNSPERVTVQLEVAGWTLTYSVGRGHRIVTSTRTLSSPFNTSMVGVALADTTACTAATGAIRTTSTVDGGMYIVLGVAAAASNDLGDGQVAPSALTSTASMFFGAAVDLASSPAGVPDVIDTFYTVAAEQLEVVGA